MSNDSKKLGPSIHHLLGTPKGPGVGEGWRGGVHHRLVVEIPGGRLHRQLGPDGGPKL
jgi:hypothetical protein